MTGPCSLQQKLGLYTKMKRVWIPAVSEVKLVVILGTILTNWYAINSQWAAAPDTKSLSFSSDPYLVRIPSSMSHRTLQHGRAMQTGRQGGDETGREGTNGVGWMGGEEGTIKSMGGRKGRGVAFLFSGMGLMA